MSINIEVFSRIYRELALIFFQSEVFLSGIIYEELKKAENKHVIMDITMKISNRERVML